MAKAISASGFAARSPHRGALYGAGWRQIDIRLDARGCAFDRAAGTGQRGNPDCRKQRRSRSHRLFARRSLPSQAILEVKAARLENLRQQSTGFPRTRAKRHIASSFGLGPPASPRASAIADPMRRTQSMDAGDVRETAGGPGNVARQNPRQSHDRDRNQVRRFQSLVQPLAIG